VICSKTSNRALINVGLIAKDTGLEYGSPSDTYRYLLYECGHAVILKHSKGWFGHHGE
jgi:hypothetical protein